MAENYFLVEDYFSTMEFVHCHSRASTPRSFQISQTKPAPKRARRSQSGRLIDVLRSEDLVHLEGEVL